MNKVCRVEILVNCGFHLVALVWSSYSSLGLNPNQEKLDLGGMVDEGLVFYS